MISHGYIVPVSIFAMVVGIVLIANLANYYVRKLKSRERLAAIEKGVPVPLGDSESFDPRRTAARTRLTAIILIAAGIGTAVAFALLAWIVGNHRVLSVTAFAIIPLAIGVGMLIDYRMQARALEGAPGENSLERLSAGH